MSGPPSACVESLHLLSRLWSRRLQMPRSDARERVLPPGALPRGLSRVQSAEYVVVSPTTFDRMIKDRLMPEPIRIYGRTVWDVRKLDVAFAELDTDDKADDVWSRCRV